MASSNSPIPVTILSGSLGAGKTTTLNHVLTTEQELNAAVLVNDMGEVNVDAEFVERESDLSQNEEEIIEMSNGCICCRLRGDMLDEVGRLAEQRDFDYLLVESSGISEPIPVAQTFARGFEEVEFDPTGVYELDTMVSVVDAHSFWQGFDSGQALTDDDIEPQGNRVPEEALMDQIEFCDVLVLNKCDLVSDDERRAVERVIRTLHPDVDIVGTVNSAINPERVLGTGRFDRNEASYASRWKQVLSSDYEVSGAEDSHPHDSDTGDDSHSHDHEERNDHDHGHEYDRDAGHNHDDEHDHLHPPEEFGVDSFIYERRRPFHPERFRAWLTSFPETVVRSKGHMWVAGRERFTQEMLGI